MKKPENRKQLAVCGTVNRVEGLEYSEQRRELS